MEIETGKKMMKSTVRSELNYTELILESEEAYQENYQIRMIKENHIGNILKVTASGVDGGSQYLYDISGMKTMKREIERCIFDKKYIESFLKILLKVLNDMNNYMLDPNFLLLNPEYIYVKEGEYYFCYYPGYGGNILESFHELTEFFVKEIDYSDYPTVVLACGMHKETMEQQYELQTLIQRHTVDAGEEVKKVTKLEESDLFKEEICQEIQPEEHAGNVIRETPVKRFWNQRKKDKWGSWDDLLICEESSIMEKNRK